MDLNTIRANAARWGQLIRKQDKTVEDISEMGMHGASLFLAMMNSGAAAQAFDQIVVAAVRADIELVEATNEEDVFGLFHVGGGF